MVIKIRIKMIIKIENVNGYWKIDKIIIKKIKMM